MALGTATPAWAQSSDGPAIHFTRQGARVCAQYTLRGEHDLYKNHLFANASGKFIPIEGLPKGVIKKVAGIEEQLIAQSFTACASAPSPEAPLIWIDQSCLTKEALCLPPRAFEIASTGKSTPLPAEKSGALFAAALSGTSTNATPSTAKSADGWGAWIFFPKK